MLIEMINELKMFPEAPAGVAEGLTNGIAVSRFRWGENIFLATVDFHYFLLFSG